MDISPQIHNAIQAYFRGTTGKAGDPGLRFRIHDLARSGQYDEAHRLTKENGLIDKKNQYGLYDKFPVDLFAKHEQIKQEVESGVKKSMNDIHPAAKTVGLSMGSLRHVANEAWNKLDKNELLKIANAVAKYGLDNKTHGRPLDSSDLVQYARTQVQGAKHSPEDKLERSLTLLRYGLRKDLQGENRDPEDQRKQDMRTDFYRKPNTYLGRHPKHKAILNYFDHYSRPLSENARITIMHDATIGEYGSAQRKLARRNDRLPAGLDGLKFGDHQIEMVDQLTKEGILGQ